MKKDTINSILLLLILAILIYIVFKINQQSEKIQTIENNLRAYFSTN